MAGYVGLDVAKAELVGHLRPSGPGWVVPNDDAGIRALVERRRAAAPALIVLEATGGDELAAVGALAAVGLPVAVVNPRQVRDFAKATGQLATTDALDAQVLARFAERVRPANRPLADEAQQVLDALLTRRRQLVDMLTAEKNRQGQVFGRGAQAVMQSLTAHIEYRERELRTTDAELGRAIRGSPVWREREDLRRSVPGVGRVVALTLLAQPPERGRLNRKQVAKLIGIAPLNRASGTLRGKRLIVGGRAAVRAVRYLGARVASRRNSIIRAYDQRLLAAGKPQKLALTARMRKLLTILNAKVKAHTRWSADAASLPA